MTVGIALDLVWAMDVHHQAALRGGASLNKAFAIILNPVSRFQISEASLRSAWSHYRPVAHMCAVFSLAFQQASLEGSDGLDERMKVAFHEELDVTLSLMAAYQCFATGFIPHGQDQPLLDPREIWVLRGIEADSSFVPSPLPPEVLSVAEAYRASPNKAYR